MKTICLSIFLFVGCSYNAICQTLVCDTCTYAIGYMYKNIGAFGVVWEDGTQYDLDEALKMEHPWSAFENNTKKYKFALFKFMDQQGYTLVTSTTDHDRYGHLYAYEWVFRKKDAK